MPDEINIERVHKIDGVHIASPLDLDSDLANKKAKGENKGMVYYAAEKDSGLERVFDEVKNIVNGGLDTIAGKNKTGKELGRVKDLLALLFPALEPADIITDEIGDLMKKQRQIDSDMEDAFDKIKESLNTKPKTRKNIMSNSKPSPQPSTVKGIAIFVSLLALVGVHLDAVAVSSAVSAIITGLTLAIPAGISLWEMVRDEVF